MKRYPVHLSISPRRGMRSPKDQLEKIRKDKVRIWQWQINSVSFKPKNWNINEREKRYSDIIMRAMVSQITGVTIVYSTVCSDADQRNNHSSASLAFVRGIRRWPLNYHAQRASNAENVSIWRRHQYMFTPILDQDGNASLTFWEYFLLWKVLYFIQSSLTLVTNWQRARIDLINGLAPNRRQVIIWINNGLIYWRNYASLILDELNDNWEMAWDRIDYMSYCQNRFCWRINMKFRRVNCVFKVP